MSFVFHFIFFILLSLREVIYFWCQGENPFLCSSWEWNKITWEAPQKFFSFSSINIYICVWRYLIFFRDKREHECKGLDVCVPVCGWLYFKINIELALTKQKWKNLTFEFFQTFFFIFFLFFSFYIRNFSCTYCYTITLRVSRFHVRSFLSFWRSCKGERTTRTTYNFLPIFLFLYLHTIPLTLRVP